MMPVGFRFGRARVRIWLSRRPVLRKFFGINGFGFPNVEGPPNSSFCEMSCRLHDYTVWTP